jgi:hypothetical protein
MSTVDEYAILSNDPALFFLKDFPAHPRQVIVLNIDCDKNREGGGAQFSVSEHLTGCRSRGKGKKASPKANAGHRAI